MISSHSGNRLVMKMKSLITQKRAQDLLQELPLPRLLVRLIIISTYVSKVTIANVPVRLVDGPYEYAGRVEVNYNGEWGTVCGDGWDLNNAQVICRQLGYGRASFTSYYGAGSGRMWLTNVNCIGSELAIEDCSHSGWGDVKSCSHLEGAGVRCSASNDYDPEGTERSTSGSEYISIIPAGIILLFITITILIIMYFAIVIRRKHGRQSLQPIMAMPQPVNVVRYSRRPSVSQQAAQTPAATEHASLGSTNSSVSTFTVKNAPSHYSDPPPPYNPSCCNNEYTLNASDNTVSTMHSGVSLVPPPSYCSVCAN